MKSIKRFIIENANIDEVYRIGELQHNDYKKARGIWFADSKIDVINYYITQHQTSNPKPTVFTCKLHFKNPKIFEAFFGSYNSDSYINSIENFYHSLIKTSKKEDFVYITNNRRELFTNYLVSQGYDSVIIEQDCWNDTCDKYRSDSKQFIAFDVNQITLLSKEIINIKDYIIFKQKENKMKLTKQFLLENFSIDNSIDYDAVFNQWYEEHGNTSGFIDEIIYDYLDEYPNPKYDGVLNTTEFEQIKKTKKFITYIKYEYFKNKYEEFKKTIEPIINSKQKIPIYRQITLTDLNNIQKNIDPELGIYWTWDYKSAKAYWGSDNDKNIINIVSEIDKNGIDWNETLLANMINPQEKELTLKSNYPLNIIELHDMRKKGEKIIIGNLSKKTFTT